jgi:hypothetical protein
MPDTRVESEPPRSEPICLYEMIDSVELAKRLTVPESWVRDRTRSFCFWQLGLAHFGSLIWPTPWNVEG